MKYTAENVTDEMVRELRFTAGRADDIETMNLCNTALAERARRHEARARIAELLNARATEEKP